MADQIYAIINNIAEDSLGGQAFTRVTDTSSLVSLGKTLDDLNLKDIFYNKFHKQISKVAYKVKKINRTQSSRIMKEILDFNTALMVVEANDLPDATNNNSIWSGATTGNMADGGQKDPFGSDIDGNFDFDVQYFNAWVTWSYEKMIPEYQHGGLFSANYVGFTNMLYTIISNSMDLALNNAEKLVLATAICTTKDSTTAEGGNPICYRNPLKEYNTKYNKSLTKTTCQSDPDFLRYFVREVALVTKKVKDPNKIYSPTKKLRWINDEDLCVDILGDISTALETYLYADVYHKELLELKGFRSVNYWLGQGTDGDFDSISRVACVTADGKGKGTGGADIPTECNGVIAVIYDIDKCMCTMDKERTNTIYNPRSEVINIFNKADIGYAVNKNSIMVVFAIEDEDEE